MAGTDKQGTHVYGMVKAAEQLGFTAKGGVIVPGLLVALVGEILSIIGMTMLVVKRKDHDTKAALICSIVGLVVSVPIILLAFGCSPRCEPKWYQLQN